MMTVRRITGRAGAAPQSWLQAVPLGRRVDAARLRYLPDRCLRDARTIVDVGAHEGVWSETVLRALEPAALIAIEPNPASFAALQHPLRQYKRAVVHRNAVASASGRLSFTSPEARTSARC